MSGASAVLIPVWVGPELVAEGVEADESTDYDEEDLPVGGRLTRPLRDAFRSFLAGALPKPWPASQDVLDYLQELADADIYVRRDEEGWFVQITYSGWGQQATVCAGVCAHWTRLWLAKDMMRVSAKIFAKQGVRVLGGPRAFGADNHFVAVGDYGYGARQAAMSGEARSFFLLDYPNLQLIASDGFTDNDEKALDADALMALFEGRARDACGGQCRCQLCAPDFDTQGLLVGLRRASRGPRLVSRAGD